MKILLVAAQAPVSAGGPQLDPGSPVLSSTMPEALEMAKAWFPDQPVKVSKAYAEPKIGPGLLNRIAFAMGRAPQDESHEELKRRVVEAVVALVDGAKKKQSSAYVGGPLMVRLLGYKLASIGYHGPLLSPVRPGSVREYRF